MTLSAAPFSRGEAAEPGIGEEMADVRMENPKRFSLTRIETTRALSTVKQWNDTQLIDPTIT